MQAQSSLKSLAGAVLDRAMQRTLPAQYPKTVRTLGAHCNSQETDSLQSLQIEATRAWLHRIGEPEEDHGIVLNKCRSDLEAMEYFLKHAQGGFE